MYVPTPRMATSVSTTVSTTMRTCRDREKSETSQRVRSAMPRPVAARTPAIAGARLIRAPSRRDSRGLSRLVADAPDRHDDLRILRVLLDLRPQPLDVHVDQPRVRGVAVAPHLFEEDLAGEDLPRLAGERHEQVELERGQRDRLTAAGDLVAGHVDRHVRDLQDLRGHRLEQTQTSAHAGDERLRLEGLRHVVVRA